MISLKEELDTLREEVINLKHKLNEGNRAGAANSWDMIEEFRDKDLKNDPIYEKVRRRRAENGNVGAASNMVAYIKELRYIIADLESKVSIS